jgi:septum formation protein
VINPKYHIILASQSPRRKDLLTDMGIPFTQQVREVDETIPEGMPAHDAPVYLAQLKAAQFKDKIDENTIVITADTIVFIENQILGKPKDHADAFAMLSLLSGKKHEVTTGVCLLSKDKEKTFAVTTDVYFKPLTPEEIEYYLAHYKPYDKAGAYGIQEWIGYVAIERIDGSFYNVMGLPVNRLYHELVNF